MIPNSLTMSAFGPYQNVVEINFDIFKQDGLFLITGPTGAGKTMIFDAITFALYGVSSGGERSVEQFRCNSAKNDVATYVILDFTLHNQRYVIKRSPKYTLEGRKTPKMPTALLTLPNGKIIDGVKEVNTKVKELLGIDEKQFKQIAMIAQGKFTELIYAGSDEREKVLRNLFKTDNLVYLEEQLKDKVREYRNKYDVLFRQRELLKENLDIEDDNYQNYLNDFEKKLDDDEKKYQEQFEKYTQINQLLNITTLNNQRLDKLDNLKIKLNNYLDNEKYYQELKENIALLKKAMSLQTDYQNTVHCKIKIDKLLTDYQNTKDTKEKTKKELIDKEKEYQKKSTYQNQKAKLQLELQKNKELKQKYQEYQKDVSKQTSINKQINIIKSKLVGLEDKQQKYQKMIESDNDSVSKLDKLKSDYKLVDKEYQKLHQYKLQVHQLSEDYDKLLFAEEENYDLQDEYQRVESIYMEEKVKYDTLENRFRLSQAGILASQLKENQPCPVCGSLNHPHLANFNEGIVYQEDLKNAKQVFDKCSERRNDLYNTLMLKKQEIVLLQNKLNSDSKRLGIEEELDKEVFIKVLGSVNIEEKSLFDRAKELNDEIIYLNKLKISLDNHRNDLKIIEKQISDAIEQMDLYKASLNQIVGRIKSLDHLKELSDDKINKMISDNEKEIIDLDLLIDRLESEYRSLNDKCIQLETNTQLIDKQLSDENDNYQRLITIYKNRLHKLFDSEEVFLALSLQLDTLTDKEKEYNDYLIGKETLQNQIKELEEELKDVKYIDITEMEKDSNCLKEQLNNLQIDLNKQKAKLITIRNTIENIINIDKQLNDSYDIYQQYLDLSELTSGKNEYRISFERYVLAAYFENILTYANILLKRMSQGRYQLYRRDNRSKGAGKQGLELDVLDLENGMLRDVKTLSGGESFKAALSLALGLSKMIQSFAGGIELNTLFIDEGFGSLDSQSLDQAIDCLIDLQQDGKLIGIISHVSELKERIDHKIILSRVNKETYISIE